MLPVVRSSRIYFMYTATAAMNVSQSQFGWRELWTATTTTASRRSSQNQLRIFVRLPGILYELVKRRTRRRGPLLTKTSWSRVCGCSSWFHVVCVTLRLGKDLLVDVRLSLRTGQTAKAFWRCMKGVLKLFFFPRRLHKKRLDGKHMQIERKCTFIQLSLEVMPFRNLRE